jgi:hypothetical protein
MGLFQPHSESVISNDMPNESTGWKLPSYKTAFYAILTFSYRVEEELSATLS